jgi:3-oxoacyl-[acyl-carrier-protein] synthase III
MARNPVKDRVAIIGVGSTGFTRRDERRALASGLEAATRAIRDAGVRAADIDGVIAVAEPSAPSPQMVASSLGLETVTHWTRPAPVVMFAIVDAVNAISSGSADTVLVLSSVRRSPPHGSRTLAGAGLAKPADSCASTGWRRRTAC